MSELVTTTEAGRVATCTLNLPDKRNPISHAMRDALKTALDALRGKDHIRAIIITGSGSAFCSGMDLETLASQSSLTEADHLKDSQHIADFFGYIYSYPKPLIAAVNGPAVAGGFGLAVLCDLTLASSDAWFSLSEVKIGFVPAIVGVYLERMIGAKRARELLLTGRKLQAREAATWGLVSEISSPEELMKRSGELADEIGKNGLGAIRETKTLLARSAGLTLEEAVKLAVTTNARARMTPECREGVNAFLNKREPNWRT